MVDRVPGPVWIIIGTILGGAATAVISASHAADVNSAKKILRKLPGSGHGPKFDDFNVEVRTGIRREDGQA
jgi:hypothetical protein